MKLIAIKPMFYRRRRLPGDRFDAPLGHARLHALLGNATTAPPEDAELQAAEDDAMRAGLNKLTNPKLRELAATEEIAVDTADKKPSLIDKIVRGRRYRTRVLTAED